MYINTRRWERETRQEEREERGGGRTAGTPRPGNSCERTWASGEGRAMGACARPRSAEIAGRNRHTLCARNVRAAIDPRDAPYFEVERWRKEQRRTPYADLRTPRRDSSCLVSSFLVSSCLGLFLSCLVLSCPRLVLASSLLRVVGVVRHRCRPFRIVYCCACRVRGHRPPLGRDASAARFYPLAGFDRVT